MRKLSGINRRAWEIQDFLESATRRIFNWLDPLVKRWALRLGLFFFFLFWLLKTGGIRTVNDGLLFFVAALFYWALVFGLNFPFYE